MRKHQDEDFLSVSDTFNLLYFAANVHASCLSPFLRSGFGAEHPGIYGVFSMFLVLFVAGSDPSGVGAIYLAVWFVALLYRRVQTLRLLRKGKRIHSRCSGYPWLAMRLPFVRNELTATGVIEPLLCVICGMGLLPLSEPLGILVMGGVISLTFRFCIESEIDRKRLQAMRDARIDQEYYSRQFRRF